MEFVRRRLEAMLARYCARRSADSAALDAAYLRTYQRNEVYMELEAHLPKLVPFFESIFEGVLARYNQMNKSAPQGEELVHIREALWQYVRENADDVRTRVAAPGASSERPRRGPVRPT